MDTPVRALFRTDNLPIRSHHIYSGKVRSVYTLTDRESMRLNEDRGYGLPQGTLLAVMVTSDRLSAFDVVWKAEDGLDGVPGKGAALNAVSSYWFSLLRKQGVGDHHVVDCPHPLVWIVRKSTQILAEGICRRYLTGSLWRAYQAGERVFCGIELGNNLRRFQLLEDLLVTPTTKGTLHVPGVPVGEDAPVSRDMLVKQYRSFRFQSVQDIDRFERLVHGGFSLITSGLAKQGLILADTKFELGYAVDPDGDPCMIFTDEVGTPDSSRIWDREQYSQGIVNELSKECFRQYLLNQSFAGLLLDARCMEKRKEVASSFRVPAGEFMKISATYADLVQRITGGSLPEVRDPRNEIIESLRPYGLVREG